jgi:two-component system OmpR family response regulator
MDITLNGDRDAGFDACLEIRKQHPTLPIVFLTSHDAEVDKISGLRLGADDYITKDVSLEYLIVRIDTLLKRRAALQQATPGTPQRQSSDAEQGGAVDFDDGASVAIWRGKQLKLPLTQYWILRELCRARGQPRSQTELMRAAKITVEPNTVTAHIKAIRDEFRRIDPSFDRIHTERGRGYRWLPN